MPLYTTDRIRVLASSAVAASCAADTAENTLATITIPAGAMGPNGMLRVSTIWSFTNSANSKTHRVRLGGIGGTAFLGHASTTSLTLKDERVIQNRNAQNSQLGWAATGAGTAPGGWGSGTSALVTGAVDTSADTTLVITGQKASSGETLTLEAYIVELIRGV